MNLLNKKINDITKLKTKYERRMPDPEHRYFVYGLNETKNVLRNSKGQRLTEYEDPTYIGFSMDIDSSSSPLFTQVPCFLEFYGLHPELRDRYELYNLFIMLLFNYIPFKKPDITTTLSANNKLSFSEKVTNAFNNAIKNAFDKRIQKSAEDSSNGLLFLKGNIENDLWIKGNKLDLAISDFYDQNKKMDFRKRVALKRHYLTSLNNLVSSRNDVNSQPNKEQEITIDVNEDIALHTELLTFAYENFVWSRRTQRQLIPENILEFNLRINVYEIRNFVEFKTSLELAFAATELFSDLRKKASSLFNKNSDKSLKDELKEDNDKSKMLDFINAKEMAELNDVLEKLERCFSLVRYTLYGCRFDFSSGGIIPINIKNNMSSSGQPLDGKIKIIFRNVHKEFFSRLVPRWTSNSLELIWLDTYRSNPIYPMDKDKKRTIMLGTEFSSDRLNNLKAKAVDTVRGTGRTLLKSTLSSIGETLGVKSPISPPNVYRPGQLGEQFLGSLKSTLGNDLFNDIVGGIV